MKIFNWPKRSGKTTTLVNILKENPKAIMLVETQSQARVIMSDARNNELNSRVYTLDSYLSDLNRGLINPEAMILIDELDPILMTLLSRRIIAATRTEDIN